jgi:hypothetical protein
MLADRPLARITPALALLLMAAGCAAAVEQNDPVENASEALSSSCEAPDVPAILAVPEGNKLAFAADASGSQVYVCTAGTDAGGNASYAWTLKAPDAKLFDKHGRQIGSHFAGPTWKGLDGSSVVGTRLQSYTADPSSIPWLLLQAASNTGHGLMSKVSYVQRLETTGGLAPTTGCDSTTVNQTSSSEYTATYYFYEAGRAKHGAR